MSNDSDNNIIDLPTITYGEVPPDKVLRGALEKLDLAIVIGYNTNDSKLYFASSTGDTAEVILLLRRAEKFLLEEIDD